MTINPIILHAILSMDSYNRGYGTGIDILSQRIGDITVGLSATDVMGAGVDSGIGFYAQSYEYNGVKIISYRGTDNPLNVLESHHRRCLSWFVFGVGEC